MKSLRLASLATLFLAAAAPADAQPEGEVTYIVKRGDTLYDLAREYLIDDRTMTEIRTSNRIGTPRLLQIGQAIHIPRRHLRYERFNLEIQTFTGQVIVNGPSGRTVARAGQKLPEGSVITTGPDSFASIGGDENTIITLPSNSVIRIIDARRYAINGKIDVQVKVLKGRGSVRAPKIDGEARFRAGTPLAVTAVRGTEFRVAYVDDGELSLTEVVEGQVDVAQGSQSLIAEAGFGVAVGQSILGEPEALLAPPELLDGSKLQTAENVSFAIAELNGAKGYRTQIARDAGFIEIIDEKVSEDPEVVFAKLGDGRYFVRSRGIAESGLEGLSKPYSFRRKRVGSEAGQEDSPLADTFKFAWRAEGDGRTYHAFQLWRAEEPDVLVVDEVGLSNTAILIGEITPGDYVWRVGTFQIDEGEVIKVWGPAQKIALTD